MACTLEEDLLQKIKGNDEAIIVVDIRRIRKKVRTKIIPCRAKGISIFSVIVL